MRGAEGAVDHVFLKDGVVTCHVIGDKPSIGLCGSGLLDLIAVLLETGTIDEMGHLEGGSYTLCDNVVLTQKDVREVQLAKAAIRSGIELMAKKLGKDIDSIRRVLLAGAFGNYLSPASACRRSGPPSPSVFPPGRSGGAAPWTGRYPDSTIFSAVPAHSGPGPHKEETIHETQTRTFSLYRLLHPRLR